MERIFITGDRQMSAIYPGLIAVEMLRYAARGAQIWTGTLTGVDYIVRSLAEAAGIEIEVSDHVTVADTGKPDFDKLFTSLPDDMPVIVIHADPMTSSVTKSALRVLSEDRVKLLTPADLL